MKKGIRRLLLSERGDSSYISRMYPRMHLIFMYYCVIILTIRVTGTDMNKNSCKAAESAIDRTNLPMAVTAGSHEKEQKENGKNEF